MRRVQCHPQSQSSGPGSTPTCFLAPQLSPVRVLGFNPPPGGAMNSPMGPAPTFSPAASAVGLSPTEGVFFETLLDS